ncbi:MAG: hypothetical protein COV91_04890 [Candidatus Taylorbacteria bacterium CG11_big_fil_rev_8_21_14_0_20_46_11]|uniref:Uncharacterized protein n=1 Tax=Candidatus Taylorbacteria bacterium CG11_big_fil_rev_8_21_14_0_20_46_11 TaxID=1975025 RepID=A0A2H0KAM9_9BACT|nr:MAG: hypothetical protein COV91_04890 [Candidatus Taylorbacteria bacterium CG11_big_fil_rev_8_21_14_0_20_46_11]
MKKAFFYSLAIALLIVPQVTLAVWWKPYTWFQKPLADAPVSEVAATSTLAAESPQANETPEIKADIAVAESEKVTPAPKWWNPLVWFKSKPVTGTIQTQDLVATTSTSVSQKKISETSKPREETVKLPIKTTPDNSALIQAEVQKQVKAALKVKVDEDARIAQQKIEEQVRIDAAVKAALDKQVAQQKVDEQTRIDASVKVALDKQTVQTKEKNYYLEAKSRIQALIDIEKSFKAWLQDIGNQLRSARLTLSGYNVGGLYGEMRDGGIKMADQTLLGIDAVQVSSSKRISYFEGMLNIINSDPKGFIDEATFNKIQTPESSEKEISGLRKDINEGLYIVMDRLEFH